jgi:hypothetical protein
MGGKLDRRGLTTFRGASRILHDQLERMAEKRPTLILDRKLHPALLVDPER